MTDATEKLPAAVLALAPLCDTEIPRFSVVQIHTEPDGDRTALATDGRIAGMVQWTPGGSSPHGTPELIPAAMLRGLQGHIVGAIEPYEGFVPSIKSVLATPPRADSFRIAVNARNLIRVLRFMQAAAGRTAAVELTITAANEMVVVEPIANDCPPGIEVRAAIMPVATRPDQQTTTPPAAHAACEESTEADTRRLSDTVIRQIDEFARQFEHAGGGKLGRVEAIEKLLCFAMEHENLVDALLTDPVPGVDVRAAIMPVAARPDQQTTTPPAAHAACDEGEQRLAMQDQIERGHLRERLNRFRDEYNAATGRSLNYRQASQLLLDWALGHVNLVESILEVEGREDS